jgi:hypothetical protein
MIPSNISRNGKNSDLIVTDKMNDLQNQMAGITMTYLRPYVTGSIDAILNEVGQTTAVSLVGAHHGSEDVLEHRFGIRPHGPAGQCQPRSLEQYD